MPVMSKEEYASWSENDKKGAARDLQREMISLKKNQEFIQEKITEYVAAGHPPSKLVAILCGRNEPFLPDVYRCRYPDVDSAVLEITFIEAAAKHAREYRWDPDSVIGKYWQSRNKDGFVLPMAGTHMYTETATELSGLDLQDNEFAVLVCSHGCASVFKGKIPRVGETLIELPEVPTTRELPASAEASPA